MPCRIAIVTNSTNGKYSMWLKEDQIVMEYKHFYTHMAPYIPKSFLTDHPHF